MNPYLAWAKHINTLVIMSKIQIRWRIHTGNIGGAK